VEEKEKKISGQRGEKENAESKISKCICGGGGVLRKNSSGNVQEGKKM